MQFSKITLAGFKSFADPVELYIEPGMTGVVGPNGCGKSNVVESIRWVMGEKSAKSMRGSGMDDVIFAGTNKRPKRNLAEVTITIDNSSRKAPAMFNNAQELEVSRRIDRGSGSTYTVNGHEVRAKDVYKLFADAATGAHSTALVSQGKIGQIISAKPVERRQILEEAAGIVGLQARRDEAESRLRAAENNLNRLQDILNAHESQLRSLERQSVEVEKYRKLNEELRKTEAMQFYAQWKKLETTRTDIAEQLKTIETEIENITRELAVATTDKENKFQALKPLRDIESEKAATLQRFSLQQHELEAESQRQRQNLENARNRLQQTKDDFQRETNFKNDVDQALQNLQTEQQALENNRHGEDEQIVDQQQKMENANQELSVAQKQLDNVTEKIALEMARRNSITKQTEDLIKQIETIRTQLELKKEQQEKTKQARTQQEQDLARIEQLLQDIIVGAEKARQEADEAQEKLNTSREREETMRQQRFEIESRAAHLMAEKTALENILSENTAQNENPVLDQIKVQSGFEPALAAALGAGLTASTRENTKSYWQNLSATNLPALPAGTTPLQSYVTAPSLLDRALSQIGVVETQDQGKALQSSLLPGQILTTAKGDVWRWDGYVALHGQASQSEKLLKHRNRLEEVKRDQQSVEKQKTDIIATHEKLKTEIDDQRQAEKQARIFAQEQSDQLNQQREELTRLTQQQMQEKTQNAALEESIRSLEIALKNTENKKQEMDEQAQQGENLEVLQNTAADLRATLEQKRQVAINQQSNLDQLKKEIATRATRLATLQKEQTDWTHRLSAVQNRLQELESRQEKTNEEIATLENWPQTIAARRNQLMDDIEQAKQERTLAADNVNLAEQAFQESERQLRKLENAHAEKREIRVRAQTSLEHADADFENITLKIAEILEKTPEELPAFGEFDANEMPPMDHIIDRVEKLRRRRENIGPVNLRAEEEKAELEAKLDGVFTEREDLTEAIRRLRQEIFGLNREGRKRLLESLEKVNTHFKHLFTRLFGGGDAEITLTENEDPLEAGLEIMASPPGKKLQSLSLLSGGEQTLTAISLMFAVFLTNPAPICVLDEVDGPLDDANVERFCNLVDEISKTTGTRFLLVTHNAMTMARMDRLFGVTMGEPGISQLVSVNLQQAAEMQATA